MCRTLPFNEDLRDGYSARASDVYDFYDEIGRALAENDELRRPLVQKALENIERWNQNQLADEQREQKGASGSSVE